jgi:hypothetical protein
MELLVPGIKLLTKRLQSQVDVLHGFDRHAIIHVALDGASDHDKGRALERHLLEEGLDPGTRFRRVQVIEPIAHD